MTLRVRSRWHRTIRMLAVLVMAALTITARPQPASASHGQETVEPLLDCVSYNPFLNELTAVFGYASTYASTVDLPIGALNWFFPDPYDRGQLVVFEPGTHHAVLVVRWDATFVKDLTWFLENNQVTATLDSPRCEPDVRLSQVASPDPASAGGELTYTLTATNDGATGATGVTITDALPGGVELLSATPSQGTCTGTETVTCDLGGLASGASATVTLVVRSASAGTLTNTATVAANEPDPNTGNNAATTRVAVSPAEDTAAPTVLSYSPTGSGVARNATVSLTFSEDMDPATISTSTVQLYQWDSKKKLWRPVTDTSVSCGSPCRTATLASSALLATRTQYQVIVTTGAQDLTGNPLAQQLSWTFTTGKR